MSEGFNLEDTIKAYVRRYVTQLTQKAWHLYSYNTQYGSQNTFAQDLVTKISTSLLGEGLGGLVATAIHHNMPSDIDKTAPYGIDPNFGYDFISTKGQTFANNLMNYNQAATIRRNAYLSLTNRRAFNLQFYRTVYTGMYGDTNTARIDNAVENAHNNNFTNMASWARMLFDPTEIDIMMANSLAARLNIILKLRRLDPFGTGGLKKALQVGNAINLLSYRAVSSLVNKKEDSFGGFTGGAVSSLGAILALQTIFLTADNGGVSTDVLLKFKKKVQDYSKSLMSLRDVFGQDMKAMITSIEAFTGQNIAHISPLKLKELSFLMQDTMRTTGLNVKLLVETAGTLQTTGAQMGLNGIQQLGLRNAATSFAYTMTQGYTPPAMTAQAVQGQRARDLASAQGSLTQENMAAAYAIWRDQENTGTFKDFLQRILEKVKNGSSVSAALMALTKTSSLYEMREAGLSSGYYEEGMMSTAETLSGYTQLRNTVRSAIGSRAYGDNVDVKKLLEIFLNSDPETAKAMMEAKSYDDLSKTQKKILGVNSNGEPDSSKGKAMFAAMKRTLNANDLLKGRWSNYTIEALRSEAMRKNREIQEALNGADGRGASTIFDVFKQLTDNGSTKNLMIRLIFNSMVTDGDGDNSDEEGLWKSASDNAKYATTISHLVMSGHKAGLSTDKDFRKNLSGAIQLLGGENGALGINSAKAIFKIAAKGDKEKYNKFLKDYINKKGTGFTDKGKLFIGEVQKSIESGNDIFTATKEGAKEANYENTLDKWMELQANIVKGLGLAGIGGDNQHLGLTNLEYILRSSGKIKALLLYLTLDTTRMPGLSDPDYFRRMSEQDRKRKKKIKPRTSALIMEEYEKNKKDYTKAQKEEFFKEYSKLYKTALAEAYINIVKKGLKETDELYNKRLLQTQKNYNILKEHYGSLKKGISKDLTWDQYLTDVQAGKYANLAGGDYGDVAKLTSVKDKNDKIVSEAFNKDQFIQLNKNLLELTLRKKSRDKLYGLKQGSQNTVDQSLSQLSPVLKQLADVLLKLLGATLGGKNPATAPSGGS